MMEKTLNSTVLQALRSNKITLRDNAFLPTIVETIQEYKKENSLMAKKPDFIIAGSMKCGTTSLYEYLAEHEKVMSREPKELHYFTLHKDQISDEEYMEMFSVEEKEQLSGEASPSYFDWSQEDILLKMNEFLPDTKFFVLLRDPVDRAVSEIFHYTKKTPDVYTVDNELSIEDFEQAPEYILRNGLYEEKVKLWQDIFGARVMFINFEELKQNPDKIVAESFEFLDLTPLKNSSDEVKEAKNANIYNKPSSEVYEYLEEYFLESKQNMKELLGFDWLR